MKYLGTSQLYLYMTTLHRISFSKELVFCIYGHFIIPFCVLSRTPKKVNNFQSFCNRFIILTYCRTLYNAAYIRRIFRRDGTNFGIRK
jgi:hypothetical protein